MKKIFEEFEEKEDIYSEKGAEEHMDDDCISSEEHGFMMGYLYAM